MRTLSGIILRSSEIARFEHTSTSVAESPIPMPIIPAVVTAKEGHVPSTSLRVEITIKSRYEKNPTQIQTKQKDGTIYRTGQTELGEIKKVEILKRGKSGVAVMAQITGSKNTLRIYTEYNLRNLFGGEKLIYLRKDKKEVSGLSCLPSGYFTIENK